MQPSGSGETEGSAQARACAVLLAAGGSTRMGVQAGRRKPFLELEGRSVLAQALAPFELSPAIEAIVVVGRPEERERIAAELSPCSKPWQVVAGGAERSLSARLGVRAAPAGLPLVAIHDVARPLLTLPALERVLAAAAREGAALLALPCPDTVKQSDDGERACATLERGRLWLAQTPQVFRRSLYLELCQEAEREGFTPTDDAALHERYRGPVRLVPGEPTNLKLTTPADLELARAILRERAAAEASR